ncbi:MAG: aspartyl-tRNA synthetase [Acidobacteria bacterium]|nr:MAG: aspartyl-tRNA synthetase [Acidobacteriota bacterium]
MERTVILNPSEVATLDKQDPSTASGGGFQRLLVKLQRQLDRTTGELKLDDGDQRRIPSYAFDYGQGGWEDRRVRIFGRTLGPTLGRQAPHVATSDQPTTGYP